jgi:hypothetical protein
MAERITYRASVSFEYDLQPVQTVRQEIIAANAPLAARRALEGARRAFPNARPRSIVVVLEVGERVTVAARPEGPSTRTVERPAPPEAADAVARALDRVTG